MVDGASIAVLGGTAVLLVGAWVIVVRARAALIRYEMLAALAVLCAVLLALLTLSDWPETWLNEFWTEHSIVGGLLSTLLLAGVAFFGLEARDVHGQDALSAQIAGTAFGGLVNPLVVVDSALLLLARPKHDFPAGWRDSKPLAWVRSDGRVYQPGGPAKTEIDLDDAFRSPDLHDVAPLVIDQCIRRVVAGARNWAALASASADGRALLAQFGRLRNELTRLRVTIEASDDPLDVIGDWARLRAELQLTCLVLELASGAPAPRPTLTTYPTSSVQALEPAAAARAAAILDSIGDPTWRSKPVRNLLARELNASFGL